MRNLGLLLAQLLFSLITLVSGVVFVGIIFGNGVVSALLSVVYLFDTVLPFIWFADLTVERTIVDRYFAFGQLLWHILLVSFLYKYSLFPADATYLFVVGTSLLVLFGFRYTIQDSFLKQER